MTKKEAAIISAYTGFMIGGFSDLRAYAEELFGEYIYTHQFGNKDFEEKLKELSKPDMLKICENITN